MAGAPLTAQQLNDTLSGFYKQIVDDVVRRVEESNNRLLAQIEARMNANLSTFKGDTVSSIESKLSGLNIQTGSGKVSSSAAPVDGKAPRKTSRNANLWFADQFVADVAFRNEYTAKFPQQANMTINDTKKNDEQRFKVIAKAIWDSMSENDKAEIKKLKEAREKTAEGAADGAASSAPLPSTLAAPPVATFSAPTASSFIVPTFGAPAK